MISKEILKEIIVFNEDFILNQIKKFSDLRTLTHFKYR